jgi:23S rRNA (pseudouridine1915-N3)-methyltransferase
MRIHLLAVGTRLPAWQAAGVRDYLRRFPPQFELRVVEIAAARRSKAIPLQRILAEEGTRLLAAIPANARVVALDAGGCMWTTEQLAHALVQQIRHGDDIALLIGGPDGLAPDCLARSDDRWSLSALTLPHGLVRVVVAEQIYRAWSLLNRHPYHR